jgi:hypothetical protein
MTNTTKVLSALTFGAILGATCLLGSPKAEAASVVIDFEGLQDLESVNNFYNGGTGSRGSGPGPNYGIAFGSNALALIDGDAGGSGNIGGEPSPSTVLFFLSGSAIMDVAAGFDTGFSFFYSAIRNPGVVNVYDGLGGMGNLLASLNLPLTPFNGAPDPTGQFSPLVPFGVSFNGIAKSVDFGGTVNQIVFDDITLGSATPGGQPIPTPAMLPGLIGLGLGILRKRKAEAAESINEV